MGFTPEQRQKYIDELRAYTKERRARERSDQRPEQAAAENATDLSPEHADQIQYLEAKPKPTLAAHLCMVQLRQLVRKKFFGGYEVPALQFAQLGFWSFCQGAAFGRARCDKLEIVAKLFVGLEALEAMFLPFRPPSLLPTQSVNNEQWVLESLRKVGSDGVCYYRNHQRKEPESLMDLWLTAFAPPHADFQDIGTTMMLARSKIRLGEALRRLDLWLFAGISFGANFPDLMEEMWRQWFETVDQKSWAEAHQAGLDIPEKFTPLTLEEMEQEVLVGVASYATEYFANLVDPLGLTLLSA